MQNLTYLVFIAFISYASIYSVDTSDDDWDILIFTQHWPLTVCLQWKEDPQHTCSLLSKKNMWMVHGIWPTKLGTKGPQFCNTSLHFNGTQLAPIEQQLEQYWGDIHNETNIYKLWKHEWRKHGTCAVSLPTLDSEIKYFGQGLDWIAQYSMTDILSKSGIEPNSNYTPQEVWDAVQNKLGKNPAVQCLSDPKTKETYLFEIRICFDKNLTLTDCDGIGESKDSSRIKTNCPNKNITYPSVLPYQEEKPSFTSLSPIYDHAPWILEGLRILQFLQWMTF